MTSRNVWKEHREAQENGIVRGLFSSASAMHGSARGAARFGLKELPRAYLVFFRVSFQPCLCTLRAVLGQPIKAPETNAGIPRATFLITLPDLSLSVL